jgi:uncharacterized membrane protein
MILYTIAYGMHLRRSSLSLSRFATASLCLSALLFFASSLFYLSLGSTAKNIIFLLVFIAAYGVMFLLTFFVAQLYFLSKNRKAHAIVIAAVVIIAAMFFASSIVKLNVDDEMLISYYGIQHLLNGINPYSQSISGIMYAYRQAYGATITISTNGSIIGTMGYPALYFIVQVPFYLISNTSLQYIPSGFLHYQDFVFFLLLLLSYLLVNGRKQNSGPDFLAIVALALTSLWLSSTIVYLMLALVVLMYSDVAKKYSWLILGLMVSLQEELWIMALLLIAYSFNSYGARRGLKDLSGTLAVFLVINGYFMLTAPSGYAHSFAGPLSGVLPNENSPVGFLLMSDYQVPLYALSYLFLISIALTLLISLYLNERKLIPLLSMIPFLFLGHALALYYAIQVTAFVMVINADAIAHAKDRLAVVLARSRAAVYAFSAAIILCVSLMFVIAYASHAAYNSGFGLYAHNQSVEKTNATTLTYSAQLSYNPKNATQLYLILFVYSNGTTAYHGLFNQSIMKGTPDCGFPCAVDVNRITLPDTGHYNLTATLPSNTTTPAYIFAILSNNDYYYRTQPIGYG